jgi:transcriptional regulator with XRE-family HTH domain
MTGGNAALVAGRSDDWSTRKVRAGQAIRRAREAKGWSEETLATEVTARLDEGTVSQGAVSNWEHGKAAPRPEKLGVIEQALDLADGELELILFPPRRNGQGDAALSGKVGRLSEEDRRYVEGLVDRLLGEGN